LDKETGLYYFGARYYDARVGRWVSADPALVEGKYFPKPNDYDTEHDFYWYLQQDGSRKLPGIGGVFNAVNLDVYHYAGQNPVKLVDPDGEDY
jgi:RHS repeat-associated protein